MIKKLITLCLPILFGYSAIAQFPSLVSFTTSTLPDCHGNGAVVTVELSAPPAQGYSVDIDYSYTKKISFDRGKTTHFTGIYTLHPATTFNYTNIRMTKGPVPFNSPLGSGYITSTALWGNYRYAASSCGCGQPVFNISVPGGVPPYTISYWPLWGTSGPSGSGTLPINMCVGEYNGNFVDARGCPVYRTLLTSVASTIGEFQVTQNGTHVLSNTSVTLCAGDSLQVGTTYYKVAGSYPDTIKGTVGCDTIRSYILSFDTVFTIHQNVQTCQGGVYTFRDGDTSSTPIIDTSLVVVSGVCDTLFYSTLTLTPEVPEFRTVRHCSGTAYTFPDGDTSSFSHTDTSWLSGVGGCDSIIITDLQVSSQFYFTHDTSICHGTIYTFPDGDTATVSRIDTSTYSLGSTCDSVIITTLTVNYPSFAHLKDTVCEGTVYRFVDGGSSTVNTVDTVVLINAKGCDSLYIVDLHFKSSPWKYTTAAVCAGSSYQFPDGDTSLVPITDTSYLTAASGCDSVIVTALSHNSANHQKNFVKLSYEYTPYVHIYPSSITYMNDQLLSGVFSGTYDPLLSVNQFPGLYSKGGNDIMVGFGHSGFVFGMGSNSNDRAPQVHAAKGRNNDRYFIGNFTDTLDFDISYKSPNIISPKGSQDIYLYRWYNNTNMVVTIGGFGVTCSLAQSDLDYDGNTYMTGYFDGKVDFDPGVGKHEITPSSKSLFVARYLKNGSLDWVREIPTSGLSPAETVQMNLNEKGEMMFSGKFDGTIDLDPGPGQKIESATGSSSAFVIVLDTNGKFKRGFALKATVKSEVLTGVLTNEKIVIAVDCDGTVDLDPGIGTQLVSSKGTYLVGYDRFGNFEWSEKLSDAPQAQSKMVTDTGGVIYFTIPGGIQARSKYGELLMKDTSFVGSSINFDHIPTSQFNNYPRMAIGGNYLGSVDLDPGPGYAMGYSTTSSHYVSYYRIIQDNSNTKVICEDSSYTFSNGDTSSVTGYHTSQLTTQNGCDSSVTIHLVVEPKYSYVTDNFCQGSVYTFPDGDTTTSTRKDTSNWTSTHGCLNKIVTTATMDSTVQTVLYDTICMGQTYTFPDGSISKYSTTDTSAFVHTSCDSLVYIHLSVSPPDTGYFRDTICNGKTYIFPNGDTASISKVDTSKYTATLNCDTVMITELYVEPMVSHFKVDSVCQGRYYQFPSGRWSNVQVLDTSRIYINGCLTQFITQLNVAPPPYKHIYDTLCDGSIRTFPDGDTATVSKTDTSLIVRAGNCHVNSVTHLYVLSNSPQIVYDTLCSGDVYQFLDGDTSSLSVIDTATILASGCPQQVVTYFTSLPPDTAQMNDTICHGSIYTFPDGDTSSIDRRDTSHVLANGCWEVVFTDLKVKQHSFIERFDSICQGDIYTFPDGSIGTSKQSKQFHFTDDQGCDSVIKVNLYVTNVTSTAMQQGVNLSALGNGSYQWIDCQTGLPVPQATQRVYTAQQNGQYAVVVTRFGCTDTSACYTITGVGLNEVQQESWIRLYPNPSSGVFILDYQGKERSFDYRITDASGKLIEEKKGVEELQTQIDLSHLSNGTYYVTVESESELDQIKVVKEH